MVKLILLLCLIYLVGCGDQSGTNGRTSPTVTITKIESCSVIDSEESVTITCPDGTSSVILKPKNLPTSIPSDGQDGKDGANGTNGTNGKDCSVNRVTNGVSITCGDTITYVFDGKDGLNGKDGIDGTNGRDGQDGADGEDGKDGQDGATGAAGNDGSNGNDGRDGLPGADGDDGRAGRDGLSCSVEEISTGARITCEDGSSVTINYKKEKDKDSVNKRDSKKDNRGRGDRDD